MVYDISDKKWNLRQPLCIKGLIKKIYLLHILEDFGIKIVSMPGEFSNNIIFHLVLVIPRNEL